MSACHGKLRHPTRDMADAHIAGLKLTTREHPKRQARLVPYLCIWCRQWHVGHTRSSKAIARRKARAAS